MIKFSHDMQPRIFGGITVVKFLYSLILVALLAGLGVPANGQATCAVNSGVNTLVRAESNSDLVGDIVIACTGGTPTAPGQLVPQVNILVTLNGTITSRITATLSSGANMNEALLLMDDPNSTKWNSTTAHPIANCGLHGEDSSTSGPGICAIVSDGTPNDTYDGDTTHQGTGACSSSTAYSCGRPNVFQGRQATTLAGPANVVQFLGIPFDPPDPTACSPYPSARIRTMRITNLRVNGAGYGVANPYDAVPVIATIAVSTNPVMTLSNTSVQLGQVEMGLLSQVTAGSFLQCVSTATSTGDPANPFFSGSMKVRVLENFATAFKVKNLRQILDNGTWGLNYWYTYNGGTAYNEDYDQNVPGVTYSTETGFYFPATGSSIAPGGVEPPSGFGQPVLGGNIGSRFSNGGTDTGFAAAGRASQGTRIAVALDPPLAGTSVFMPIVVALRNQANGAQTGIMVLTDTDTNGAGVFTQASPATLPSPVTSQTNALWAPLPANNVAVYEVLFSDARSQEYADIYPAVVYDNSQVAQNLPTPGSISATVNYAPLNTTADFPRFGTSPLASPTPLMNLNACTTTTAAPATTTYSPSNQNVTLSATVANVNTTVNGGTVAFTVPGVGGPVTSGPVSGGNASVSFPVPGGTPAGPYGIQAVYSGTLGFGGSSDSSKTLSISRAAPVITWANPADIVFGSALGSGQLNATANVPGTFIYTPPAGTVLPVGTGEILSTTFTPTDAVNYSSATATALINVLPGPVHSPAQLVVTRSLSRDANTGEIVVVATITNTGSTGAGNVKLTVARIGSTATTTALPQSLGAIGAGSFAQVTVRFPGSTSSAGTATTVTLGGTYGGGSFASTARVTLP